MHDVATAPGADPSLVEQHGGRSAPRLPGRDAAFQVNYPFVYPAAKDEVPKIFANMGCGALAAVDPDEPAHVTLGGFNLGVGEFGDHKNLAFEAARCLEQPDLQVAVRGEGRPAADHRVPLQDPRDRQGVPVRRSAARDVRRGEHATGEPGLQRHLARGPAHAAPAVGRSTRRVTSTRCGVVSTTRSTREGSLMTTVTEQPPLAEPRSPSRRPARRALGDRPRPAPGRARSAASAGFCAHPR